MRAAARAFSAHDEAHRRGLPASEVLCERAQAQSARAGGYSRRELLAGGAGLAVGAALAHPALSAARRLVSPNAPRIAIVGAGLAGVRCAHMLWRGGRGRRLATTIYEANPERAGGRCWTLRDYFGAGLVTEHGGAFLDSDQHHVRRLARSLGLREEVVNAGALPAGEQIAWIAGGLYREAEVNADWASVGYRVFRKAIRESASQEGARRLDGLSVMEWLEGTDIGASSRFGRLMLANTVTENGGNPEEESALNLIELLAGNSSRSKLEEQTGGDERFHIAGGNDQMVTRMLASLPAGTLRLGSALIALRANSDGTRTCVFDVGGGTREVTADVVVLALPFSTLREVDLSASGLSAAKRKVIQNLGMGSNAKVHIELAHKTWPALGYDGSAYGEWDAFGSAWDDCVPLGPGAAPALYVGYPGGRVGASGLTGAAHGPAPTADVGWFLGQIEQLFPGTTAAFTGRAYEDHWAVDPFSRGAYSYPRVGQSTSYLQIAAAREGATHFAGEHTSVENEGFLDGAVESGERAAREILRRY